MLTVTELDDLGLEDAASLVADEHTVARAVRCWLPVAYTDPRRCRDALAGLLADGFIGFAARAGGRCVGVLCGRARGVAGFLPADGVAIDPGLADPTPVVVRLFAALAPRLLEDGALRFLINHVDLAPLGDALSNLGFGRGSVFGTQAARAARPADPVPGADVRIGSAADLDSVAALSYVELLHRGTAPIYAPPLPNTLRDTRDRHARLLDAGAVHLLARIDGLDVGLLTIELTSPAPRLCPDGQPYIGPTATHPSARGRGVGHALVHAALDWAHRHDYLTVSVDFDSPNPLSRPFWTGLGFQPVGYGVRRTIDTSFSGPPS